VAPSLLKTVGGVRVGVFGVADPELAAKLGGKGEIRSRPGRRGRAAAAGRRGAGRGAGRHRQAGRPPARRAMQAPIWSCSGARSAREWRAPSRWGRVPGRRADEIQRVGRIDIVWRGRGPLSDAGGPEATALRRVEIEQAVARIDKELEAWTTAKSGGDPAFIAGKRRERDALLAERGRLDTPWAAPATGSYFTNRLVPLRRTLPRDPKIAGAMRGLDARIGAANRRAAAAPPPPEPDRPYYVGRCQVRELSQDSDEVLEEDRARRRVADAGRRWQAG
jgi:hypothetical protein